jgi:dihydropyrimidinase
MNLLLRHGNLVLESGIAAADLLIQGEKISRISTSIDPTVLSADTRVIDCSGLFVFPGFIDAHTHFGLGEGEARTADGFYEGSVAAAIGGVTTFIDFADQMPGQTLLQGAQIRIGEAADAVVDFTLHQGVYRFHPGIGEELDDLARAGVMTLKIFTTYRNFGVFLEPSAWDPLFALCAEKRFLVTIHAEDEDIIAGIEREIFSGSARTQSRPSSSEKREEFGDPGIFESNRILGPPAHPLLRPARAEASAIMMTGISALRHHLPLYFVHVSSAPGVEAVRELRRHGLKVVAETTPHYLLLTEERLAGEDGAFFLMTPPLRSPADRATLLEALVSGEIDVVATDHCSYTPEQKKASADCREIPAGVPGTGEAASLLFTLLPGIPEDKAKALGALFSRNPAKIFGLYPEKGSLEPGTDADVVVFDPNSSGVISKATIKTAAGYSPYEGLVYQGAPVMTIFRGKVVAEKGEFVGTRGAGRFHACGKSEIFADLPVSALICQSQPRQTDCMIP